MHFETGGRQRRRAVRTLIFNNESTQSRNNHWNFTHRSFSGSVRETYGFARTGQEVGPQFVPRMLALFLALLSLVLMGNALFGKRIARRRRWYLEK